MPHVSRRRSRASWVIPAALTLTAAAATAALWWWMDEPENGNGKPVVYDSDFDADGRSGRRRPLSGVKEETEPESERMATTDYQGRMRGAVVQQQDQEYKYVPPVRKRGVALVVSEKDPEGKLDEQEMTALKKSSFLSFLPLPAYNPNSTNLFFILHQSTDRPYAKPIQDLATTIAPESHPEFFLNYRSHPDALVNMLRALEPETVYVEQELAGENGELVHALLQNSWVGYVVVVLGGGADGLAGLLDSDDERDLAKTTTRWWEQKKGGVLDTYRGRCTVVERAYLAEDWARRVVERG